MDLHGFLLAALILLSVTAASVALFKRLGLGSLLGLLAAGVIVGPSGFAIAANVDALRHFTEIGVVFLLFIIGLEMRPEKLWSIRRAVFGLGALQVLLTGAVITAYVMIWLPSWNQALLIGFGLALSSTAFVLQLLEERGETLTAPGRNAFGILLFQDLAVVPLLALVPILSNQEMAWGGNVAWKEVVLVLGVLLAVYVFGRYLVPYVLDRLARQRNIQAFNAVAMLTVLGAAWAMEEVGLSMALGGFMMGMLLSGSRYRHQVEAVVEPFKNLLLSLFFISVGMAINFSSLPLSGPRVALDVVAILVLKAAVLFLLCLGFRLQRLAAFRVAFLLPQCGEFGFVLFGAAAATNLLNEQQFAYAVFIISMTMVATPPVVKLGDFLIGRFAMAEPGAVPTEDLGKGIEQHVVVAGYGRVGRIVCIMLEQSGVPYLAFDADADRVALGKREHHAVHFGDVSAPRLLAAAGVSHASAVVVTVGDPHTAERVVSGIRNFQPETPVITRVKDLAARDEMLALGAAAALPDAVEASLQLGEAVLHSIGVSDTDTTTLLSTLRRDDYAAIRSPAAAFRSP